MVGSTGSPRLHGVSDDDLFAAVQGRGAGRAGGIAPRAALEELFERYHARVHAWCARLLGDDALADDATQEIFLRLLVRRVGYEGRKSFGAWLYVVARNHCLNTRRRRARDVEIDPARWLQDAQVARPDPAGAAESEELQRVVRSACAEVLTRIEQEVLHLRFHWGMRVKEIGAHLRLENVSGARTHLATATRKLRAALVARLGEDAVREWFQGE